MSLTSVPYQRSPSQSSTLTAQLCGSHRIQSPERSPIQASRTAPIKPPWLTATRVWWRWRAASSSKAATARSPKLTGDSPLGGRKGRVDRPAMPQLFVVDQVAVGAPFPVANAELAQAVLDDRRQANGSGDRCRRAARTRAAARHRACRSAGAWHIRQNGRRWRQLGCGRVPVSGASSEPCHICSRFASVSPWRTRITRVFLVFILHPSLSKPTSGCRKWCRIKKRAG